MRPWLSGITGPCQGSVGVSITPGRTNVKHPSGCFSFVRPVISAGSRYPLHPPRQSKPPSFIRVFFSCAACYISRGQSCSTSTPSIKVTKLYSDVLFCGLEQPAGSRLRGQLCSVKHSVFEISPTQSRILRYIH